jgi:uncharacterized coiled-coil protein SlyX
MMSRERITMPIITDDRDGSQELSRELERLVRAIESVDRRQEKQEQKLDKIAMAINTIAAQDVKITNMQGQMDALWRKFDAVFGPEGTLSRIQRHQASCPRAQFARMWWAIGLLATLVIGLLVKAGTP